MRLRLDPGLALHRRLTLPLAAERHLAAALRLQAEIETPYRPEDCLVGGRVVGRGPKTVEVVLAVAPTARVEALVAMLGRAGFPVAGIETAGPDGTIRFETATEGATAGRQRRDWVSVALGATAAVLAGALLWLPWARMDAAEAEIRARIEALRPAALRAERLMAELDAAEARREAFAALGSGGSVTGTVEALSLALPDDAWLEELTIEDGEVRLLGFAKAASSLPAALGARPGFSDAALRAPVTRAAGAEVERFDLRAAIDRGAAR